MTLLFPWMLIVALAMVVPPILHLIGANRARKVQFSALQFLLAKDPNKARALRIERWILVATRMAIFGLLAYGLAEPTSPWFDEPSKIQLSDQPSILVVVLDDSLSMSTRNDEGVERFAEAQRAASRLLESMPAGSRAAVVMSGRPARSLHPRPSDDIAKVIDDLNAQTVRGVDDDAAKALLLADRLSSLTSALPARIVVFGDLQKSGWREVVQDRKLVQWQSIGSRSDDIELLKVSAAAAPELGRNKTRIRAQIRRHGRTPWAGDLTLSYGDKEMRSKITVPAGDWREHEFVVTANSGVATLSLQSSVGARLNDSQNLLIGDSETLRILLINGDSRPVLRDDEAFFIRKALAASALRPGEMSVTLRSVGQLRAALSRPWDVVVLANVHELDQQTQRQLVTRVQAGMGLCITMGANVPLAADSWLTELVPAQLATRVVLAGPQRGVGIQSPGKSSKHARQLGQALESCKQVKIWGRWMIKPSKELGASTVLTYSDGAPLWVFKPRGAGSVSLWTTSIDRDWTNLPLAPCYLPLMRHMILRSAGRVHGIGDTHVTAGQSAFIYRHSSAQRLRIEHPALPPQTLLAKGQPPGLWKTPAMLRTGVYTLTELGGDRSPNRYLLSLPSPKESEPDLLQPPTLAPTQRKLSRATGSLPLWSAVFLMLMGLLIFEMWWLRPTGTTRSASRSNER